MRNVGEASTHIGMMTRGGEEMSLCGAPDREIGQATNAAYRIAMQPRYVPASRKATMPIRS